MENLDASVQPDLRTEVRRGRASRQAAIAPIIAPRRRCIPAYALLGEAALAAIEDQADWILDSIGIEFRGDQTALGLFAAAGARVEGERIRFPAGLARRLCATAPA